ncbi:hypothetical protein LJ753_05695 [Arthrobacter sp. zg-Y20]|uniref:lantibiotic dehydratase C-terminal domain-containing protein n=1 Tax=unclassified Arthrobacter TaxID=235627 RepID=UPI001D14CF5C|nr:MULTISPECIES: lantibiotic dehydratase C-terminal domain-containing protein [unclassified Arthrobacter]MCC3275361.1 hypothetical protein [Arthrobacter sp. zg-Y20]MDK1315520.1 lantibiotic dehydratase C-terminal domain-containing protein [Arthrobacter sp. zg.Y20]WIB05935.1 lantibiotic dehydratase C-terminal domain-containing protein [Arthrobacter sp. zg-Y20]
MSQTAQAQFFPGVPGTRPIQQQSGSTAVWSILEIAADPQQGTRQQSAEPEYAGDGIIRHIVIPLSAKAQSWGGYRFGFSRSKEPDHPAVQLHLLATHETVERVWKFAHALAEGSTAKLGAVKLTRSSDVVYPPRPGERVPELMEATFSRFGGAQGLKLASDVAEVSMDLALWAVNRFPRPSMRSMLAALLLFDTAHAMMRGPRSAVWPDRRTTSWDFYWNTHLQACTASFSGRTEQGRKVMLAQMAPRITPAHRVMGALASEPSVDLWRKRWAQTIDLYLYRVDKQRISRSAQRLALASSGVLQNRLGIPLREEAALGIYARAWSKEKEAQLHGQG